MFDVYFPLNEKKNHNGFLSLLNCQNCIDFPHAHPITSKLQKENQYSQLWLVIIWCLNAWLNQTDVEFIEGYGNFPYFSIKMPPGNIITSHLYI